jgi:hypothetical protein
MSENPLSSMPFPRAAELWLEDHKRYIKANTLKNYQAAVRLLIASLDAVRVCDQFCSEHPPQFRLGNGGHTYSRPVASYEDMLGAIVSGDHNPEASRQCGIMAFIDFLDKPYCFEFANCRECGRYFDMGRKPKEVYPSGIHCPRHECQRAQASKAALVATQKARVLEKVERLALAARVLAKWREPAVNPDSEEIFRKAKRENWRQVTDLGLSANWITRHRSEIDKFARQIREEGITRGALQAR